MSIKHFLHQTNERDILDFLGAIVDSVFHQISSKVVQNCILILRDCAVQIYPKCVVLLYALNICSNKDGKN